MILLLVLQGGILVEQDAFGSTIEVFVLAAAQGPHEGHQASDAEDQGDRHQVEKVGHRAVARWPRGNLRALPITAIEEPDMAIAATRGVTKPAIAIGTASRL